MDVKIAAIGLGYVGYRLPLNLAKNIKFTKIYIFKK
jgi:UDP-N-acetyl-D-mannosaminuronate dehydrogenase